MSISVVFSSLSTLFTLLILGYVSAKFKLVEQSFLSPLSHFLLNIVFPLKIFTSIIQPFDSSMIVNIITIMALQLIIFIGSHLFGLLLVKIFKVPPKQKGVWLYATTFPNAAFMGFPILLALFGTEGLFYGSITNIIFNIYSFTIGIYMIKEREPDEKINPKEILLNPVNIAVLIGLIFFVTETSLPPTLSEALTTFGDMSTPLSMFILGGTLARLPIKNTILSKNAYIINIFRLLILPTITYVILSHLPIDILLIEIIFLITAMPCATLTLILNEQYDGDTDFAASTVFLSNLLCMITIPILLSIVF
ncbi:MAG: hypothetical protein ATN36_03365 [Epulopiscium sp. Nele67-Bin005]|nr:MAG: hypothetical protein ATN36_03365 [Epulopiscium sp. Nele67-Bin005]